MCLIRYCSPFIVSVRAIRSLFFSNSQKLNFTISFPLLFVAFLLFSLRRLCIYTKSRMSLRLNSHIKFSLELSEILPFSLYTCPYFLFEVIDVDSVSIRCCHISLELLIFSQIEFLRGILCFLRVRVSDIYHVSVIKIDFICFKREKGLLMTWQLVNFCWKRILNTVILEKYRLTSEYWKLLHKWVRYLYLLFLEITYASS